MISKTITALGFTLRVMKKKTNISYKYAGNINKVSPFLFTAKQGLFLYQSNKVLHLFSNRCFGLTKFNGHFFFSSSPFQYEKPTMLFSLSDSRRKVKLEKIIACADVHQIDCYFSDLFITDSRNNRLIVLNNHRKHIIYPNGKLINGVDSNNYAHFNSVFINKDYIYLMAHNHTTKTGRKSSIYKLDRNTYQIVSIYNTPATDAHDLIVSDGKYIYCDSSNGHLMVNDKSVLHLQNYFLRGIGYNEENILIGLSEIAPREDRNHAKSIINIYNYNFELLSQLIFQTGVNQIYDLCFIENEMSLSQSFKNNSPFPIPG